jgi:hypothetical protein
MPLRAAEFKGAPERSPGSVSVRFEREVVRFWRLAVRLCSQAKMPAKLPRLVIIL